MNLRKDGLHAAPHVFILSAMYGLFLMAVVFIGCSAQYLECNVDPEIAVFNMLIPILIAFIILFLLGIFYAVTFLYVYSYIKIDHAILKKAIGVLIGGISGTLPIFVIKLIFFDDGYSVYISTEYILCFCSGAITSLSYFLFIGLNEYRRLR